MDWYFDQPRWLRVVYSLIVLGVSGVAWMLGAFWPWGWGVLFVAAFLFEED
jgi:hypothetical protein